MKSRLRFFILANLAFSSPELSAEISADRLPATKSIVAIQGGSYSPLFREKDEADHTVASFFLDKDPVTVAEFSEFLRTSPEHTKERISKRLAEEGYLSGWSNSKPPPGKSSVQRPVTSVSWFAARAFCQAREGRLPTIEEWEFAADAQSKDNLKLILNWYGEKSSDVASVDTGKVNRFGVRGMHGLIWEWVDDFSSVIIQGDSRSTNETGKGLFCGAGALNAKRPEEYATFMRYAFRSSLKARTVTNSLGFRCAYDKLPGLEKK